MVRDLTVRKQLQDEWVEEKNTAEFYNDILTHDVNNLLHATIGNLVLMSDEMSGKLNRLQEQQRQKALAGARRCAALVDQVRELMMIRHLDPASFTPRRLTKLLQEAADVVREQFPDEPFTMNLNAQGNQFILGHRLSANLFIT
jgi:signal transduction histidine kinase